MMENISIIEEFRNDDVYQFFLTDDFDVKVITSSAVQLVAVSEHLAKLSAGVILLDKELHHQVANQYENLLSQATEIETLEGVLLMVNGRIQTLLCSADRIRRNVVDPYEEVSSQTVMLVRLQMTCDLLRRIIRVMQLCRRLDSQLKGNLKEITKAAQSVNELDYLMEGIDLSGLHIVENHLLLIKRAREQIYSHANVLLLRGIETQICLDVATALGVFHHLQVLQVTVQQILQQTKDKICLNIQEALDVSQISCLYASQKGLSSVHGPGRAAIPLTGNTAVFRTNLWNNMEGLMSNILNAFIRIRHLQTVLLKKQDSSNQPLFSEECEMADSFNLVQSLWEVVTKAMTQQFSQAADESTYIKQAFEVEFPKLLCLFNDFLKSLCDNGIYILLVSEKSTLVDVPKESISDEQCDISRDAAKLLRNALSPFECAYLSRCLSRLIDSVNVAYADEAQTAPTKKDIGGIVMAIKSELSAANIDSLLLRNVSKNVVDTIDFFVEKCHSLVSIDLNSSQVVDQPNSSQVLNAQIVHLLNLLQKQILEVLQECSFDETATFPIKSSLQSGASLITITIQPVFQSIFSAVRAIIITMHKEDFSSQLIDENNLKTPDSPCSLYMKELQNFINRSQSDYLSLYPNCDAVRKGLRDLASQSVEMFVRHASLVRPLGDGGKMKLAADCAQMEMIVTSWCNKLGDLGKAYKLLRSFRPLLFQTSNHIVQSSAIGDIVPYSITLHLLIARAPSELKLPHEVAGWSLEEYSNWLDEHVSEKERLILMKGSLEKYVTWVKQKQNKEFCSLYPVIIDVLQKGLQCHS